MPRLDPVLFYRHVETRREAHAACGCVCQSIFQVRRRDLTAAEYSSIHPTFHTKLLRKYVPNNPDLFPAREPGRPPPIIPEDDRYEVEEIRDSRRRYRRNEY